MYRQVLCLDIGTTRIKGAVLNDKAECIAAKDYLLTDNAPLSNLLILALKHVLGSLSSVTSVDCIVISGNGPTLVPLDRSDRILEPILLWYDTRAVHLAQQQSYYLPKARWFCNHGDVRLLKYFLPLPEYVAFLLGASPVHIVPNDDYAPYVWDNAGIQSYELDAAVFPPRASVFDCLGTTTNTASMMFSIKSKIPIFCSGIDYLMSMVGTNTLRDGYVCDRSGTSEGINYCLAKPKEGEHYLPHLVSGLYTTAAVLQWSGTVFYHLFRLAKEHGVYYTNPLDAQRLSRTEFNLVTHDAQPSYAEFNAALGKYGEGEKRQHIAAMLYQLAYAVKEALQKFEAAGHSIKKPIRMSGGQCEFPEWVQYKSDCIGMPIVLPHVHDAELVGSLCVALCAGNVFSDLQEAADVLVCFERCYEPKRVT